MYTYLLTRLLLFHSCNDPKTPPPLPANRNTLASALNWLTSAGSVKGMCRIEDRVPGALVIPGPAKSKARQCASPYPRNSMNGSSKPSPIGGPSRKPFARCSLSAERNSLSPYPVLSAERNSAKIFSDWFKAPCPSQLGVQCHRENRSSEIERPKTRKTMEYRRN